MNRTENDHHRVYRPSRIADVHDQEAILVRRCSR
jgi:hypothetical protein